MADCFVRYLLMLREIPPAPKRVDTATLAERLEAQGIRVTRRTLQRDLEHLSRRLPIRCDDDRRPYGWTWVEEESERPKSGARETLREVAVRVAKGLAGRRG